MAIKTRKESECRGCDPCIGCGRDREKEVEYLECDKCHDEVDKLYVLDGKQLCECCLYDEIETIEI